MKDESLESWQVYDQDELHCCKGCEGMVKEGDVYCKSCLTDIYHERD